MIRRVVYVSGARADFGLLESTLLLVNGHPAIDLSVCVTGMHLLPQFGLTVREIEASGLRICARVEIDLAGSDGAAMARAIGQGLIGMVEVFSGERPDLVVLLGDRGEMLAGAIAAIHLNIPVVHIHGGELSGSVDESVRHAISKLSHYHFVATAGARERLIRMGERADRIFETGAPGLDGLSKLVVRSRQELCANVGFMPDRPVALLIFHPVVQEAEAAGAQMQELLAAVRATGLQVLCLSPNSDAGNDRIRAMLKEQASDSDLCLEVHLARPDFVSWMAAADVMVGNSSSGIIEAASLGLPVVNVGNRQKHRERSGNVVDCPPVASAIRDAIERALALPRRGWSNVYGDGKSGRRIVELLATLPLPRELMMKTNAY